jgi:metallo-beta-lactamase family protein
MTMQLQFLGAAGTVTGSKYLLTRGHDSLMVDCGLFQGYKPLRLRNWAEPSFNPADISAVVLTHAHVDHSGYLPLLVKKGFRGRIYASQATAELCHILLPDSARLSEEDAERANRHNYSKHKPALPLYTERDAEAALRHFVTVDYDTPINPVEAFTVSFRPAGHILGASSISVSDGRSSIVFSGDLGRPNDPIMYPPRTWEQADYLVLESTYGDRLHQAGDPVAELEGVILRTIKRGGTVVIPAFAVGRTQEILYAISTLKAGGRIPQGLPVYLNSPMAQDTTNLYQRHRREHRLSDHDCEAMHRVAKFVTSIEESKALNLNTDPKILIAGSGMATGGRVIHHIASFAPREANTICFVGFQAGGTRGAAMLGGAREVKIHGDYIPVNAEVVEIGNMSAHADARELLDWLGGFRKTPKRTFITHGEPAAADALRLKIQDKLGWQTHVPDHLEQVSLDR